MNYFKGAKISSKRNARAVLVIGLSLVVSSLVGCSKATSDEDSGSDSNSKASVKIQTLSLGTDPRGACYEAVLASHGLLSWSALDAIGNAAGLVLGADARAAVDGWPTSAFEAAVAGTGGEMVVCRSL